MKWSSLLSRVPRDLGNALGLKTEQPGSSAAGGDSCKRVGRAEIGLCVRDSADRCCRGDASSSASCGH